MIKSSFSQIQILLPEIEKDAFKRACFLNNTTMTREIRRFIYSYCETSDRPSKEVYANWLTDCDPPD